MYYYCHCCVYFLGIAPTIDSGNGLFDLNPSEGRVKVGNSTCETRGGVANAELTKITCFPSEDTFDFTTVWYFNGERLTETTNILTNKGPGVYTCVLSLVDCVGTINATTVILGKVIIQHSTYIDLNFQVHIINRSS